jgi:hypothetical protein
VPASPNKLEDRSNPHSAAGTVLMPHVCARAASVLLGYSSCRSDCRGSHDNHVRIAVRRGAGKLFERSNVGGKVSRLNSRQ